MSAKADELKERTASFADRVIRLVRELPNTLEARKIGGQLIEAATSVAANYRASCRARSHAEFVSKIGTVEEEADESDFWLSMLVRSGIAARSAVDPLLTEAGELVASSPPRTKRPARDYATPGANRQSPIITNPQ
jgi:four helix bundle protein